MPSPENTNFDAEIVSIIDREIESEPPCLLKGEDPATDFSPLIYLLSQRYAVDFTRKLCGDDFYLARRFEKHFLADRRKLIKKFGNTITDTILEGRLRLHLLLNTPGGRIIFMQKLIHAANQITSREGQIVSWVGNEAASAGAILFERGHLRYGLTDSMLMWHLSSLTNEKSSDPTQQMFLDDEKSEQMNKIREFFRTSARASRLGEIMTKIDLAEQDPSNEDNHIVFNGTKLKQAGIMTRTFRTPAAMRTFFREQTGITDIAEIDKFFSDTAIVCRIFNERLRAKYPIDRLLSYIRTNRPHPAKTIHPET